MTFFFGEMQTDRFEKVIGFDVREMWRDPQKDWNASRRMQFLLNTRVNKPLSVDTMVWASVFDGEHLGDRWEHPELPAGYELWPDYKQMMQELTSFGTERLREFWTIAVTVVAIAHSTSIWEELGIAQGNPKDAWQFLGYDIADEGLISALTNCGYFEGEMRPSEEGLNKHHLFLDLKAAVQFSKISDVRVPEHKPFYVYGIYRLQ